MGRQSRIDGLSKTLALLDAVPSAAEQQMIVELAIIGRELLAAQHADVARDTGTLDAALSMQVVANGLKVRVGLLKGGREAREVNGRRWKAVAGGPFYGRFVEFGRHAQTVLVTRRIKARKVKGNGRYGTKRRVIYSGKAYKMRVKAMAARPFVAQPLLEDAAALHLADYWSAVLSRAGGGA